MATKMLKNALYQLQNLKIFAGSISPEHTPRSLYFFLHNKQTLFELAQDVKIGSASPGIFSLLLD